MSPSWAFEAEQEEEWISFFAWTTNNTIHSLFYSQLWQPKLEETFSHISSFTHRIHHWGQYQTHQTWLFRSLRSEFHCIWFHQFTGKANETSCIQKKRMDFKIQAQVKFNITSLYLYNYI